MTVNHVIILARKHIGKGDMVSSARLCLSDAIRHYENGDYQLARERAVRSLAYSVGMNHADYRKSIGLE